MAAVFKSEDREAERCFRILQLPKSANQDDIKRSYKRLALECHPDKNEDNPDATRKFQELSYAYRYLTEGPDFDEANFDEEDFDIEVYEMDIFELLRIAAMLHHMEMIQSYQHCIGCPNCRKRRAFMRGGGADRFWDDFDLDYTGLPATTRKGQKAEKQRLKEQRRSNKKGKQKKKRGTNQNFSHSHNCCETDSGTDDEMHKGCGEPLSDRVDTSEKTDIQIPAGNDVTHDNARGETDLGNTGREKQSEKRQGNNEKYSVPVTRSHISQDREKPNRAKKEKKTKSEKTEKNIEVKEDVTKTEAVTHKDESHSQSVKQENVPKKKLTKKQLIAEQRRREKEMEEIAAELEQTRQREIEKERKRKEMEKTKQEEANKQPQGSSAKPDTGEKEETGDTDVKPKRAEVEGKKHTKKKKNKEKKKDTEYAKSNLANVPKTSPPHHPMPKKSSPNTCTSGETRSRNSSRVAGQGFGNKQKSDILNQFSHSDATLRNHWINAKNRPPRFQKQGQESQRPHFQAQAKSDTSTHSSISAQQSKTRSSMSPVQHSQARSSTSTAQRANAYSETNSMLAHSGIKNGVFHPLVPPLTANIWQERQQFYQALQPHTEEEEERMLIQALEQSKKDAEDGLWEELDFDSFSDEASLGQLQVQKSHDTTLHTNSPVNQLNEIGPQESLGRTRPQNNGCNTRTLASPVFSGESNCEERKSRTEKVVHAEGFGSYTEKMPVSSVGNHHHADMNSEREGIGSTIRNTRIPVKSGVHVQAKEADANGSLLKENFASGHLYNENHEVGHEMMSNSSKNVRQDSISFAVTENLRGPEVKRGSHQKDQINPNMMSISGSKAAHMGNGIGRDIEKTANLQSEFYEDKATDFNMNTEKKPSGSIPCIKPSKSFAGFGDRKMGLGSSKSSNAEQPLKTAKSFTDFEMPLMMKGFHDDLEELDNPIPDVGDTCDLSSRVTTGDFGISRDGIRTPASPIVMDTDHSSKLPQKPHVYNTEKPEDMWSGKENKNETEERFEESDIMESYMQSSNQVSCAPKHEFESSANPGVLRMGRVSPQQSNSRDVGHKREIKTNEINPRRFMDLNNVQNVAQPTTINRDNFPEMKTEISQVGQGDARSSRPDIHGVETDQPHLPLKQDLPRKPELQRPDSSGIFEQGKPDPRPNANGDPAALLNANMYGAPLFNPAMLGAGMPMMNPYMPMINPYMYNPFMPPFMPNVFPDASQFDISKFPSPADLTSSTQQIQEMMAKMGLPVGEIQNTDEQPINKNILSDIGTNQNLESRREDHIENTNQSAIPGLSQKSNPPGFLSQKPSAYSVKLSAPFGGSQYMANLGSPQPANSNPIFQYSQMMQMKQQKQNGEDNELRDS